VVVADFRREYGISWNDLLELDVAEFCVIVFGVSREARLVEKVASAAATVPVVKPQSVDDFVAQIQRHPRAVVEVVKREP